MVPKTWHQCTPLIFFRDAHFPLYVVEADIAIVRKLIERIIKYSHMPLRNSSAWEKSIIDPSHFYALACTDGPSLHMHAWAKPSIDLCTKPARLAVCIPGIGSKYGHNEYMPSDRNTAVSAAACYTLGKVMVKLLVKINKLCILLYWYHHNRSYISSVVLLTNPAIWSWPESYRVGWRMAYIQHGGGGDLREDVR